MAVTEMPTTGMLGLSAEDITRDTAGWCWFPTGPMDARMVYGHKLEKHRVTAVEDIRVYRDVIMADGDIQAVREHTPVEAKILGYIYDDYAAIAFTATPVPYKIGTQAQAADPAVPRSFLAEKMYLTPSQNCMVRFASKIRVEHFLALGVQYEYQRRTDILWIRWDPATALAGTLRIRALGNEVGI